MKVSIHLADLNDFDAMNEVYREFFKGEYPARTTVQAVLRSGRKNRNRLYCAGEPVA